MSDYNTWDKKAKNLVEEAEEDDKREKDMNDVALGLTDGPQGPPTQKARERRADLDGHSEKKKEFIAGQEAREIKITHSGQIYARETLVLSAAEHDGKAIRFQGCQYADYEIPDGVQMLKLFVDRCRNATIHLKSQVVTSTVEMYQCSDVDFKAGKPVATVQCDECTEGPVRLIFTEPEHMGTFYHQNAPSLEVALDGGESAKIGRAVQAQFVTRPGAQHGTFHTEPLVRGEKDYPVNSGSMPAAERSAGLAPSLRELESPALPAAEESKKKAEAKRLEGNEAFRANDFLQAAAFYTEALRCCLDFHLCYANRAQCFLSIGQPEKALEDAKRCTELAPDYPKGWFRRGMAFHAMKQYDQAIPALRKAEKLDPKNSQIPEAIKMAQLMCRQHGSTS